MNNWLITAPVWGPRCTKTFVEATLPALRAAMRFAAAEARFRFIVHTDHPSLMAGLLAGVEHECFPVPPGRHAHDSLGDANRHAISDARPGERIAFVNADMVMSIESFAVAESLFASGKKLLITTGTRTLTDVLPPVGAKSRDLLKWAWAHRHPWIRGTTWGSGKSALPSLVHFEHDGCAVCHGFHLHPWAVIKAGDYKFQGTTTDFDLVAALPYEQIHIHENPDEMSFAELSPRERDFGYAPTVLSVDRIAQWAQGAAPLPAQRWQFKHRIVLVGDPGPDFPDMPIVNSILQELERRAQPQAQTQMRPPPMRIRPRPRLGPGPRYEPRRVKKTAQLPPTSTSPAPRPAATSWQQEMAVQRTLGIEAYVRGDYDKATELWAQMMVTQKRIADSKNLQSGTRYLRGEGWTNGIGHIALLDFFVKRKRLGFDDREYVVWARPQYIANKFYLDLWAPHLRIVEQAPLDERLLSLLEDHPMVLELDGRWLPFIEAHRHVVQYWDAAELPPLLNLPLEVVARGWEVLRAAGVPRNSWFATLHVREGGGVSGSPNDTRSFRNASLGSYGMAVQAIRKAGGVAIRVGKDRGSPLDGLLDLGASPDWMDIFLLSQCRFFVGTNSGPCWVAGTFGVPACLTNWGPPAEVYPYAKSATLRKYTEGGAGCEHIEAIRLWEERGGKMVDNTPEELAEFVTTFMEGLGI